jgi:predicted PurR-regulated permease PerM
MPDLKSDLTRTILAIFSIGVLAAATLWVLRPFLPALVWATLIVVPTWGPMRAIERFLWGSRVLAVAVMTSVLVLALLVPLSAATITIVANSDTIIGWTRSLDTLQLPAAPPWLEQLPLVGSQVATAWNDIAVRGLDELAHRVAPYAQQVLVWFLGELRSLGLLALQFVLTVIITAALYGTGERVVEYVRRFGWRLAGEHGERVVALAGQAIRGVALGIVVTAFIQAVLGGIGFAIAGIPFAAVFTVLMFILAVAQIGAAPVVALAALWLFRRGDINWAIAMGFWTIVVGGIDNIIRPVLIRRGLDLPLLLIFAGVIGGLLAFGLAGLFIGPVVLAVSFTLMKAWIGEAPTMPDTGAGTSTTSASFSSSSDKPARKGREEKEEP